MVTDRAVKILEKHGLGARANFQWEPKDPLVHHWSKMAAYSSLVANSYNLLNYM